MNFERWKLWKKIIYFILAISSQAFAGPVKTGAAAAKGVKALLKPKYSTVSDEIMAMKKSSDKLLPANPTSKLMHSKGEEIPPLKVGHFPGHLPVEPNNLRRSPLWWPYQRQSKLSSE